MSESEWQERAAAVYLKRMGRPINAPEPEANANEALAVLRHLAGDVEAAGDHEPWAVAWNALDELLSAGGDPPDAWMTSRRRRRS